MHRHCSAGVTLAASCPRAWDSPAGKRGHSEPRSLRDAQRRSARQGWVGVREVRAALSQARTRYTNKRPLSTCSCVDLCAPPPSARPAAPCQSGCASEVAGPTAPQCRSPPAWAPRPPPAALTAPLPRPVPSTGKQAWVSGRNTPGPAPLSLCPHGCVATCWALACLLAPRSPERQAPCSSGPFSLEGLPTCLLFLTLPPPWLCPGSEPPACVGADLCSHSPQPFPGAPSPQTPRLPAPPPPLGQVPRSDL